VNLKVPKRRCRTFDTVIIQRYGAVLSSVAFWNRSRRMVNVRKILATTLADFTLRAGAGIIVT